MTNIEMMRKRLEYHGGVKQEDRMIQDKYRTLQKTLQYSYQGCDVQLIQPYSMCYKEDPRANTNVIEENRIWRALINPDKTKQDYDDKILSIDYKSGFGPGDVFRWKTWNKKIMDGMPVDEDDQSTSWLIYLPALNEDAYFRAEIRLCRYIIKFRDINGVPKYTWAAIRGPVETQIESIQKNQDRVNVPNLTLNILLPRNEDTLFAFDRYMRFLFAGRAWKVLTHNSISTKNIIEITAGEDFINEDKDDKENELIDGLVIQPVDPNPPAIDSILGQTFIIPKRKEIYEVCHSSGQWSVKTASGAMPPVYVEPIKDNNKNDVAITWNKAVSGEFILVWTDGALTLEKTIVVESLF